MFKQDKFSELTDKSIEITAGTMTIEDQLLTAEDIDRLDDKCREDERKVMAKLIKMHKRMLNNPSKEEIEAAKKEYPIIEAECYRIMKFRDYYEALDDNLRYSNIAHSEKIKHESMEMSHDLEGLHLENYKIKKSAHACRHETDTCEIT